MQGAGSRPGINYGGGRCFVLCQMGGCWWLRSTACGAVLNWGPHLHSEVQSVCLEHGASEPLMFYFSYLGCSNSSHENGWMRWSLSQWLCPNQKEFNFKRHLWWSLLLLQLLYEDSQMVTLTAPYIAGFLAFRETPFLLEALQRLRGTRPELLPQVHLMKHNSILKIFCQCGFLSELSFMTCVIWIFKMCYTQI